MSGCKGPITTFIVEPFIPHNEEFYLNIVSERLGNSISFSECGGIEIEENWDKVVQCIFSTLQIKYSICFVCKKASLITHKLQSGLFLFQVKTAFVPTGVSLTPEIIAPLVATLPLEVN